MYPKWTRFFKLALDRCWRVGFLNFHAEVVILGKTKTPWVLHPFSLPLTWLKLSYKKNPKFFMYPKWTFFPRGFLLIGISCTVMASNALLVIYEVSISPLIWIKESLNGNLSQKWGFFQVKKSSFEETGSGNGPIDLWLSIILV